MLFSVFTSSLTALGVKGAGPTPQFSAPEIQCASRGCNRQSPCLTCSPFPALQSTSLGWQGGGAAPEPNLQVGSQSSSPAGGPESESSPWGVPDGQAPLPVSFGTPLPLLLLGALPLPRPSGPANLLAATLSLPLLSWAQNLREGPELAQHLLWPSPVLTSWANSFRCLPLQGAPLGCPPWHHLRVPSLQLVKLPNFSGG